MCQIDVDLPIFFANNVSLFVRDAKSPMLFCQYSLQWNSPMFYRQRFTLYDIANYNTDLH